MSEEMGMRTAACSDYERLLEECKDALFAWKMRREEICRNGPRGKLTGDELQRLQAEYARAYSRLERHVKNCDACRFTRQPEETTSNATIRVTARKELPV